MVVEELIRIRILDYSPSPEEFQSSIEPTNVPAVFKGCVEDWKAFSLWNPSNGGLQYLMERVGSSTVDAMLSNSAPVFYGDIRSHERVQLPFSSFIGYCKKLVQNSGKEFDMSFEPDAEQALTSFGKAPEQLYLAQVTRGTEIIEFRVPIMNVDEEERVQLGLLREDIRTPIFLETKKLASINLWMSTSHTRSSTHYDPHHNLLCIVAGGKQVVLWPPSASPLLYPMPLYGEASNHSAVTLESPDLSMHPRAKNLMEYSQTVVLNAGDALFIPEGWFHQVDSEEVTIAVNFWWQSNLTSTMSEHMDAYYLRIILRRLTDKQMDLLLHKNTSGAGKSEIVEQVNGRKEGYSEHTVGLNCEDKGATGNKLKEKLMLHELEPQAMKALHELVSLVHHHVNCASTNKEKGENDKFVKENVVCLEDDPVASIFWNLHPLSLQNVFLAMAHNFPRTLEGLILHLLSPIGAEVLTKKFDEIDKLTAEEDRNMFYEIIYGSFDDQFTAMDAILSGKESFAQQAFKNVLDQYLGVDFNGPKPTVR